MSGADSDEDRMDALTERYRNASASDPARPSEAVRQSILAHARTVAAAGMRRRAANDSTWRIATAASVMVAGLATLLAWHVHAPTPPRVQETKAAASNDVAHTQLSSGSTAPRQPTAPRSRARTGASPEPPHPAHDAAADLETDGGNVTSLQPAPARLAAGTAAKNATAGSGATGAESGRENSEVAAPAAPPALEARQSQTRSADAAARIRAAPGPPLLLAAGSGDLERLDQLLRGGMSTEETDARGRTALLVATLRGDVPMVQRLLEAGARTDAADEDGDTPLAAARRQGSAEIVRLLQRAAARP